MAVTFYQGDTRKALRAVIQDQDGTRLNLTGGEARLFAVSDASRDRPTSNPGEGTWNGVVGVLVSAVDGEADFQGLGGLLDLGASDSQTYACQVKFISQGGLVSWSDPFQFIGSKPISEAGDV